MSNNEALARLDAEIEALRDYVVSDDETDAAEAAERTERIKQILASLTAREPGPHSDGRRRAVVAGPA